MTTYYYVRHNVELGEATRECDCRQPCQKVVKAEDFDALALKLQHWRTDEPPRSVLLLTWVRGVKEHSGAMWTREGYWLMPWHGEDGWAAQFRNAACKHLDADTLDVVGWMPLWVGCRCRSRRNERRTDLRALPSSGRSA